MRGWMKEEIVDLLPPAFFEDPISLIKEMRGEVIKESGLHFAAIFSIRDGRKIFLKRYKTKGTFVYLKFFILPSKARKEWTTAYELKKRELPVPEPFGWMERVCKGFVKESYYLSEAIGSGILSVEDGEWLRRSHSIEELAKTMKRIHEVGLFHKDLHARNFLWHEGSFFLTDFHRGEIIRHLSLDQILWDFSYLFHSLRAIWGEEERFAFMSVYFKGNPLSFRNKDTLLKRIQSMIDRRQRRHWRSGTKGCLKESAEFSIHKEKGIYIYRRRDYPLDQIKKMVETHLHLTIEEPSSLAKHSQKITVSILDDGRSKVAVKQFRYPHLWGKMKDYFRRSKGLKSWIAGNGLRTRGIASLLPLALVERKNGLWVKDRFFLMETSGDHRELDRYILRGFKDFREKRDFIRTFTHWLSHFHRMNLYHRDMKTSNIVVTEKGGSWNFYFLDLEDVALNAKVGERRLFKNFLQLHTSLPKIITQMDRFRFFKEYLHQNPIIKDRKEFIRRLIEQSKRRGYSYTLPFVRTIS